VHQHAVVVPGEQFVPLPPPDDLDDVPPRPAEDRLELLDDLAVAPNRTVQALEVAVDDEDQVVQAFPRRQGQPGLRFGLVHLAVAQERPHALVRRVLDPPVVEVPVEPGLVDRVEGGQAHRHAGVLPELRHQAGVRVAGETGEQGLLPEPVELVLLEPAFEVGPGVHAWGGVPLEVDVVAAAGCVLAAEEMVEAHLVQRRSRRIR